MTFDIIDLGLVDYNKAFLYQEELNKKRAADEISDTVIFCSHPSVVTLGRSSKPEDLFGWTGDVVKTNRGGRATYHGPEQLIVYPILKLKNNPNIKLKDQDVRGFLETLEDAVLMVLEEVGLKGKKVSSKPLEEGQLNRGVWVNDKKITSIGIAVRKWVTMHGLAMNINKDPLAFTGIQACGFNTDTYTSLEEQDVIKAKLDFDLLKDLYVKALESEFLLKLVKRDSV